MPQALQHQPGASGMLPPPDAGDAVGSKRRRADDAGGAGGSFPPALQMSAGAGAEPLPSLSDERLAGVPSVQLPNSCARLQEVTLLSIQPNPTLFRPNPNPNPHLPLALALALALTLALAAYQVTSSIDSPTPAAPMLPVPSRQRSRGQAAADLLPTELRQVAGGVAEVAWARVTLLLSSVPGSLAPC